MPQCNDSVSGIFCAEGDTGEERTYLALKRLLLYMRGLDIRAFSNLELASETLRRSGTEADLSAVMAEMRHQLAEHGVEFGLTNPAGQPLTSVMPMNRRSMLAGDVRRGSVLAWTRKTVVTLFSRPDAE